MAGHRRRALQRLPDLDRHLLYSPRRAGTAPVAALDGVDLAVEPQERAARVGRSGAGKSTVARLATGLVSPVAGTVEVVGQNLADEPASMLDASLRATVTAQILEVQQAVGATLMFITHDLALARRVADRIVVLEQGRIIEDGPTERILADPAQEETRVLLAAARATHRSERPTLPETHPPRPIRDIRQLTDPTTKGPAWPGES